MMNLVLQLAGGIGGKRYREELERLMLRENAEVAKCEHDMVGNDDVLGIAERSRTVETGI